MREIKFRAWDKVEECMAIVACLDVENKRVALFNGDYNENPYIQGYVERDIDEVKIMQYTGLYDKNSTEIYVGDIVKRTSMAPGGIVALGVVVFIDGTIYIQTECTCVTLFTEIDELEIIGNIYENPKFWREYNVSYRVLC